MTTHDDNAQPRITRADFEAKFRELAADVDETANAARSYALSAAAAGGLLLFGVAFVLGRRRGRRRSTVVEIRRI